MVLMLIENNLYSCFWVCGVECVGTMWYDDVRDDAMKIIFEKLDAFFKGN